MTIEEAKTEWLELGDRFDAWKRNGIDPSDDDSYTPYMEACLDRWGDLLNFANGKKPGIMSRECRETLDIYRRRPLRLPRFFLLRLRVTALLLRLLA